MIVKDTKLPAGSRKPTQPAKPIEKPLSAVEKALLELPSAIAAARPQVTMQIPPRLNTWVFQLHRNSAGQITSIDAKGAAK